MPESGEVIGKMRLGADLIVVGSGRPRTLGRAVAATTHRPAIGRASDEIVRAAHRPVLVVRGDMGDMVAAT